MNPENYKPDRQIVPLEHRPNIRFKDNVGYYGIVATEGTKDVWIHCENPVEVER